FRVDVEAVRLEVTRLLNHEAKSLWNGRVQTVAITNSTDKTMLLRVLASASDPDTLFDLRCMIREKLIAFLSGTPQWLPVVRSEAQPVPTLIAGKPVEKSGQA
ncbi:MAG: mechanosensitive ion channel family protein, partial [Myxococcaceae bacterium]